MLPSLYSGVTGMKNFQTMLNTIGNNIANVDTTAFKDGRVTFQDMISQTINGGSPGINPQQVGTGSQVASVDTIDTQGSLQTTGRTLDLAIQGDGYFTVQDSSGNNNYTRAGNFYLDNSGNLVTATGAQVLNSAGTAINIPVGSTNLAISPSGQITYTDPTGAAAGPIQLGFAMFANPGGLTKVGDNLYQPSNNSGAAQTATPGSKGAGTVQSGFLEMSNVNLSDEMTNMIVAERGFDANTKIISTSDAILQELINLKQGQ